MKHTLKEFAVCAAVVFPLTLAAQIKVNYKALPDYDYTPPVKEELGIPWGNAVQSADRHRLRSNAYQQDASLPDHWNNALTKHFPPFFSQSGPSCMGSSFTGYIFTHELNSLRNLEGEKKENQMAVFFGWLQTFMNSSKEDVERDNGCPNAVDYGGRTNSETIGYYTWRDSVAGWMQGYDKWHRAMSNRAEGFYTFPLSLCSEEGRLATKRWLYNHNGDDDFNSGGLCYVTLAATGMSYARIASTPANEEAGAVNKYYIRKWGSEVDHAMTIIGWDDRLEFDFNGNGIYGEESADEKGAWIVANSWGPLWCNGGWIYVPYRYAGPVGSVTGNYFWQPYVTYVRKDASPTRTIKLLMDYSRRNELRLSVGINPDTSAARPLYSTEMTSFKNAGNGAEEGGYPEVPMLGKYVDGMHYEPMEFGYDLTGLSDNYDPEQPLKYFFTVNVSNRQGAGHIYKASIMDYRYETEDGTEVPFDIDSVAIGRDAGNPVTISVVVPGEAVNPPVNTTVDGRLLKWDNPVSASLRLNKFYIYKDNTLLDSVAAGTNIYTTPVSGSTYCVSAVYGYKGRQIESVKGDLARNAAAMPSGDNLSLTLADACMIVPEALPERLVSGTVEFWIKPSVIGTRSYTVTGSGKNGFFIEITPSGQVAAGWNSEDKAASAARSIKAGTWQHVAVVVQKNTLSIYVNGMRKAVYNSTGNNGIPALGNLLVGTADSPFAADIDELRIWRTARTQAEIYSGRDNPVAMPSAQPDLVCYLPMNTVETEYGERVQEYVFGNHAYLVSGERQTFANDDILNGSSFTLSPSVTAEAHIYANRPYRLHGTGSTNVTSWQWDTPGATTETHRIQSPYVTYAKEGVYTVSLTVTDADGKTLTTRKEITVSKEQLPEPDFEIAQPRLAVAQPFSFVNRTKSANCSYRWEIEGQDDIMLTNAVASFGAPGVYKVTLKATNGAGTASLCKTVEVYEDRPTGKFNVAPDQILLGETTYLEDKSLGQPTEWLWTLTNGRRYIQINGQFSSFVPPAPGIYDISLQTVNKVGVNTASKARALYVSTADAKNGLVFVGNDEQLHIPRPFETARQSFTVEWWMNPCAYAGAGAFEFGDLSANCTDKGQYSVTYKGKTTSWSLPVTNQWHHYALTFDKGSITVYFDGEKSIGIDRTGLYTTPDWPDTFRFGRTDSPFNGYIDEMRIWDTALTEEQLRLVCNKPIENPSATERLCVYYDFNQNGGDVTDRTGNGYDAKRVNFGPDGDAWIVSPGVFTLDLESDMTQTDVSGLYLTNYKAPFLTNGRRVPEDCEGATELLTESETSTWVFDSPQTADGEIVNTAYVDSRHNGWLTIDTEYSEGTMTNKRLWQTVTLPQGHYRFSLAAANAFYPQSSRLVVCYGDTIVRNETMDEALASCMLAESTSVDFDVMNDNTEVSLGLVANIGEDSGGMGIRSFSLTHISSASQSADGISDAYDALGKGVTGNFIGERGAIRIVSDKTIDVKIYDGQGRCVFNEYFSGNRRIPLSPGVYVANGTKVLVR